MVENIPEKKLRNIAGVEWLTLVIISKTKYIFNRVSRVQVDLIKKACDREYNGNANSPHHLD